MIELTAIVNMQILEPDNSFKCNFSDPSSCKMTTRSTTAQADWKWLPKQFLHNITQPKGNIYKI